MEFRNILIFIFALSSSHCQDFCTTNNLENADGSSNGEREENNGDTEIDVDGSNTIIRLNENDAQNLDYKWEVQATNKKQCKQKQRCTLLAWESQRRMENFLSAYKINKRDPEIVLDNSLIEPDMEYIVKLIDANNEIQKEFKVPMDKAKVRKKLPMVKKKLGLVQLFANPTTYADLNYFITANLTFCEEKYAKNAMVEWEILDSDSDVFKKLTYKGVNLKIPSRTLTAGKKYEIAATVISEETQIDSKKFKLTTLKRGLILKLNSNEIKTGPNQFIRLVAAVSDPDISDETDFQLEWSCKFEGSDCNVFEAETAILELDSGFEKCGRYEITAKVSKEGESKSETCVINVDCDITRSVEIYEIPDVVNPSDDVELVARITKLISGCLLQWICVERDGFSFIDVTKIPNYEGILNVTVKTDAFLDELTEFLNETADKDFRITIPPTSDDFQGLKGDTKYLFRLSVKCPDNGVFKAQEQHADVIIHTNSPPEIMPLSVNPNSGFALTTQFTFVTEKAEDRIEDEPLFYHFGYVLKNKVFFATQTNAAKIATILPYTKEDLQTLLKVCDSRGSCDEIEGPKIKVNIPNDISEEDDMGFKESFKKYLNQQDYKGAFILAHALVKTYKGLKNDLLQENMEHFIAENVNQQFEALLDTAVSPEFKIMANELIINTKDLSKAMKLPEELLSNLIKLRSRLVDKLMERVVTPELPLSREALLLSNPATDNNVITLDYVQNQLEVLETVITGSSNNVFVEDQKTTLLTDLDNYLGQLCSQVLQEGKRIKLELDTVSFNLEKLSAMNFKEFMYVSLAHKSNFMIVFQNLWAGNLDGKFCVGKAVLKDYLGKEGNVFMVKLYDAVNKQVFNADFKTRNIVKMAGTEKQTCAVYAGSNWAKCKRTKAESNRIECKCKEIGYFSLDDYTQTEDTSTMSPLQPLLTTSTIPVATKPTTDVSKATRIVTDDVKTTTSNENVDSSDSGNGDSDGEGGDSGNNKPNTDENNEENTNNGNNDGKNTNRPERESTTEQDVQATTAIITTTSAIKTANIIKTSDLSTGDKVSLIIICLAVLGMLIIGILAALLNRVKRERTIETFDELQFPKYANVYNPEGLQSVPQ